MSADAELGMVWWNAQSRAERAEWLRRAGSAVPADAWEAFKRRAMVEGGLPCPDCVAAAARQGREFEGGYLHPSRDYTLLLHCNGCCAYWARVDHAAALRHVPRAELHQHKEVTYRR